MIFKRTLAALLAALTAFAPIAAVANTTTTVLGLNKPGVGADADAWGGYLNTNADTIDALFSAGPVLLLTKGGTGASTAAGARTALGLGTSAVIDTGTSGVKLPLLSAANAWSLAQTFTVAPAFTDQSGSRTALGLGTAATQATGTSGATVPLLNTANTWSGQQQVDLASSARGALYIDSGGGAATDYVFAAYGDNATFDATTRGLGVDRNGKVTIGTSAGGQTHAVNGGLSVTGNAALGDANGDKTTIFGHLVFSGTAPTISAGCGTGSTVQAGSTDVRGTINTGTTAGTSCTLAWSGALAGTPICVVSTNNGGISAAVGSVNTANIQIGTSADISSAKLYYICVQ